MKKVVLGVLAFLVLAYIIFDKVSDAGLSKEFLQKQSDGTYSQASVLSKIVSYKESDLDNSE
jgi:hypothetical protein